MYSGRVVRNGTGVVNLGKDGMSQDDGTRTKQKNKKVKRKHSITRSGRSSMNDQKQITDKDETGGR